MSRDGFVPLIILFLLAAVLIGGGIWYYKAHKFAPAVQVSQSTNASSSSTTPATSSSTTMSTSSPGSDVYPTTYVISRSATGQVASPQFNQFNEMNGGGWVIWSGRPGGKAVSFSGGGLIQFVVFPAQRGTDGQSSQQSSLTAAEEFVIKNHKFFGIPDETSSLGSPDTSTYPFHDPNNPSYFFPQPSVDGYVVTRRMPLPDQVDPNGILVDIANTGSPPTVQIEDSFYPNIYIPTQKVISFDILKQRLVGKTYDFNDCTQSEAFLKCPASSMGSAQIMGSDLANLKLIKTVISPYSPVLQSGNMQYGNNIEMHLFYVIGFPPHVNTYFAMDAITGETIQLSPNQKQI